MTHTISLGGSIIAPGGSDLVDIAFLKAFFALIRSFLNDNADERLILVSGGGAPARLYQAAFRAAFAGTSSDADADAVGVAATRLNAALVKALAGGLCQREVITNPSEPGAFVGRVLVASGWKPGFSSDFDAVLLAEKFGGKRVINLSNIEKVYTADPKKDPSARPIDAISWPDFRKMVGDTWVPGANVPFDPIASREAERVGLQVVCAAGRNLENLRNILCNRAFVGTVIG
jgi:uridylate kinase